MADHANHGQASHGSGHSAGDGHGQHGSMGVYMAVFFALLILSSVSFMTYFPFWHENVPVFASRMFMLAIAMVKASLVMLIFMHLKWEAAWKYVLTIPTIFMAIFLMVALVPDIGYRTTRYSPERKHFAAEIPAPATTAPQPVTDPHSGQ